MASPPPRPVALTRDIIDLQDQLHSRGRQPRRPGAGNGPPGCSDADLAPFQRHVRR